MSSRELRWVVSDDDPRILETLLARLGSAAAGALEQGRVFVEGRRITDPKLRLVSGQVVTIATARREHEEEQVRVLDERDGLLAAYKPAALSTEPDRRGSDSLASRVEGLRGLPGGSVHALSRLDHGVSGVVLLATTAAARRHATLERERGRIRRRYVAIAETAPGDKRGLWQTPVDDRPAATQYACVAAVPGAALLALEPATGRTHQLRVHASGAGAPLLGDPTYGGPRRRVLPGGAVIEFRRIALHATTLTLPDVTGASWRIAAPIAGSVLALWEQLGGLAEAWDLALADDLFPLPEEPEQ